MDALKRSLILAAILWFVGMIAGVSAILVPAGAPLENGIPVMPTPVVEPSRAFVSIMGRNLGVYGVLLGGLLSAGISSALGLLYNGVALGWTLGLAWTAGVTPIRVFVGLAPHGVLELPALLAAGAIGLQGGPLLSSWLRGRLVLPLGQARMMLLVAAAGFLAVVVAAAVEAWVSLGAVRPPAGF
ncbi:MAG TPA: stage II sporulation protein M [Longimicrobiales bacterium]|nr:stage II sporulation protein M [Longimicrobiales bacterium]